MNSKKEVLEKWFKRVWTEEDTAAIHEMFVPKKPDDQAYGLKKEDGLGPDDFVGFQQLVLALVKDVRITIDSYIEQGDVISAECTLTALNRKSDSTEPVIMKGCVIGKIVDGKILSAGNHFDFLHFFEALGLLPEDTLEKCLTGNKVF